MEGRSLNVAEGVCLSVMPSVTMKYIIEGIKSVKKVEIK